MSSWSELNARDRPGNLPSAIKRQTAHGVVRYALVHDDVEVDDPAIDTTGRFFLSPREYGFSIRGFTGGKTAWARDFSNGTMLVVNTEGVSHVLSPKVPARIIFLGLDGTFLQDTGVAPNKAQHVPDLFSLRLTVNVKFDLHGESPETARVLLMRLVDQAMLKGLDQSLSQATILNHQFEGSSLVGAERRRSSDTDFSQLLDI